MKPSVETIGITICGGIILLVAALLTGLIPESPPPPVTFNSVSHEPAKDETADEPIYSPGNMPVLRYNWHKGGFNSVYVLDYITIENKNPFAVNGVTVGCDQIASDGTVFGTAIKPLHEHMEAGQTKTFRNITVGLLMDDSVARSGCMVLGAVREN